MSEQYELESVLTKEQNAEAYRHRLSRKHLDGSTVKNVYRAMMVQHKDGTWEVVESERLKSDFADYKKTHRGKWKKLDKRRFSKEIMNTVEHYKTR